MDERENTRLRFEQHKHGEKKQLFYGFAFLHLFIATANKRV